MQTHIIEQYDQEDNQYNWVAVDKETARALYESGAELYYVREDAEGRIDNLEDLEEAISFDSVCPEDSYLWESEFEEGEQNRFRNNNFISFEEWVIQKIESLF